MKQFFAALILLFFVSFAIAAPIHVASPSMEDTLLTGDVFLALKFWYGIRLPLLGKTVAKTHIPVRDDLVIIVNPIEPDETLVKRIVAVGGQKVRIEQKKLFVDDIESPLPPFGKHGDPKTLKKGESGSGTRDFLDEITLPDSTVFVMGDNRDFSIDSRIIGPIPVANIRGKVGPVLFSASPDSSWKTPATKIRWKRMFKDVK